MRLHNEFASQEKNIRTPSRTAGLAEQSYGIRSGPTLAALLQPFHSLQSVRADLPLDCCTNYFLCTFPCLYSCSTHSCSTRADIYSPCCLSGPQPFKVRAEEVAQQMIHCLTMLALHNMHQQALQILGLTVNAASFFPVTSPVLTGANCFA